MKNMNWKHHFQTHSEMAVDFTAKSSPFGSDFQDPRERRLVPSPYKMLSIPKGATRHPDYDVFGQEENFRRSTDFPSDVQDYLPADPARLGKSASSTDDFSGFGLEPDFDSTTMGGFGGGRTGFRELDPSDLVGKPPKYEVPAPPPKTDKLGLVHGEPLQKSGAPLWAKLLGGVAVFLGGLFAERFINDKLDHKKKGRRR